MAGAKAAAKKQHYSKKDYKGLLYLLPWLIGFAVLQLYPFIT